MKRGRQVAEVAYADESEHGTRRARAATTPPPWLDGRLGVASLDDEFDALADYLALRPAETAAREALVADVAAFISTVWPGVSTRVRPFGSWPAGLSLFSSDIDLTVYGPCGRRPVTALHEALAAARPSWLVSAEAITGARVPIVTLRGEGGVDADICFSCQGNCGLEATAWLSDLAERAAWTRPLVLALKVLLVRSREAGVTSMRGPAYEA